jgi:hypothetical protein
MNIHQMMWGKSGGEISCVFMGMCGNNLDTCMA